MAKNLFKMTPRLVPRVWGGHWLDQRFGTGRSEQPIGEAWLVADLPEGQSTVDGVPLSEVVARNPDTMRGAFGDRFPLLVKVIHAAADLSIQVHPGHHTQHLVEGASSKDECWMILDAKPGATIFLGFRRKYTKDEVRAALKAGTITELLAEMPVRAGDVFRIPPGVVHAIRGGITLLEIQEPSDTTFRVFDYNRPGLDGRLRPLQLEQALAVAEFGPVERTPKRSWLGWDLHACGMHYAMLDKQVVGSAEVVGVGPRVVIALEPMRLESGQEVVELGALEAAIVPAGVCATLKGRGRVVLALSVVPDDS